MKIKKSKFVVGALLSLVSVAVVGSVTSTVAWYTYNTKDSVSYHGIASGQTENLQIKLSEESVDKFRADVTSDEMTAVSIANKYAGSNLSPVTFAETVSSTSPLPTFIGAPTYLDPNLGSTAKDKNDNYLYFKADFSLACPDPASTNASGQITNYLEQKVYISYLNVHATTEDGKDVSEAVRMHFKSGDSSYLVAPGHATSGTTSLYGPLDLNADGQNDKGYLQQDGSYSPFKGDSDSATKVEVPYGVNGATEGYFGHNNAVTNFSNGKVSGTPGIILCTTNGGSSLNAVTLTLTIWLEGWDDDTKGIIDANAGAEFDIDMLLQVETLD